MGLSGPLPFKLKFSYGLGQLSEGLKNGALASFLLFYYSQVLGMTASVAASAAGTAVIVDGLVDPIIGSLSDHWKSRFGRRHPFMFAAAIPLAICFYLLFNPLVRGDAGLFVWMVVFANLTRVTLSAFHIPHLALGAELSNDFNERSSVVGYRVFFGMMGGLMTTFIGFGLFFKPTAEFKNGQLNPAVYPPFALTIAMLMAISMLWSAWGTRGVIPFVAAPRGERTTSVWAALGRMFSDVVTALRCGSFRWLFLGVLVLYIIIGVDSSLNVYMYTYFWDLSRGDILALAPMYPLGMMIGTMLSSRLAGRFGKRPMLLFGTLSWAFLQSLPIVLRLLGWFPDNASALLVPTLAGLRLIHGICTVQSNVAYGSMVADAVDENELATGKRLEGVFFSASSFSSQASVGIGTIIAGFGLTVIDWPSGPAIRTAADVAPETVARLGFMYGPFVAAFGLVCVWCYSHYKLTRERHAEILRELEQRRQEPQVPSAAA